MGVLKKEKRRIREGILLLFETSTVLIEVKKFFKLYFQRYT